MNDSWKSWVENALQTGQQGWKSMQGHISDVTSKIGGLTSKFSLVGLFHSGDEDKEIIHYFLIPTASQEAPNTLYVIHSFPQGASHPVDLKKHRIFHLPDATAMERMRQMVLQSITASKVAKHLPHSSTEAALIELGEAIDENGTALSGGIMLIGGALTLVNPVVGAAMIAGSLVPQLGSWISRKTLHGIAGSLAGKRRKKEEKIAEKSSQREMRQSTCETYINPILQHLAIVASPAAPSINAPDFPLPHHFTNLSWYALTLDAVCQSQSDKPKASAQPSALQASIAEAEELRRAWRNIHPQP